MQLQQVTSMNYLGWLNVLTNFDTEFVPAKIWRNHLASYFAVASIILFSANVNAQDFMDCGSLEASYGPFDYTNPIHVKSKLPIVEKAHFTRDVENLIRGSSTANVMGDISYTLRTFPNHHRALYAMVRYMLRQEKRPIAGTRMSPECWFDRAVRFAPNDGNVRFIYGIYLHRINNYEKSLQEYTAALESLPDSGELHYNLGLLYLDMGDYASSRRHAEQAYELGHPLPALRNKLEKIE